MQLFDIHIQLFNTNIQLFNICIKLVNERTQLFNIQIQFIYYIYVFTLLSLFKVYNLAIYIYNSAILCRILCYILKAIC